MQWLRLRTIVRAYLIAMAFWCGFAFLMALQYIPFNRQNPWGWFVDLMLAVAQRASAFAFWTPPIFYLVGRYLGFSKNRFPYILCLGLGAVLFVILDTGILWLLVPPYDDTLHRYVGRSFQWWLEMIRGGFADQTFIYIDIVVAAHAYEYLKRLRREERERYEYQQALAASELQALKMQLHPHFLFNTLHGIATLIESDARSAKAMIIKLSSLLRTALDRDSSDLISLEEELKFLGEYLDLEKMRFGSRLKIEWLVAPESTHLLVPQMILQPLVENAIRHGVASSREGGWIEIAANANAGVLNIRVRNSVGGKPSVGRGLGLRNVEARLKYLYSGEGKLLLTVADDRTATASLSLPALNSQPPSLRVRRGQNVLEGEDPLCAFSSSTTNP